MAPFDYAGLNKQRLGARSTPFLSRIWITARSAALPLRVLSCPGALRQEICQSSCKGGQTFGHVSKSLVRRWGLRGATHVIDKEYRFTGNPGNRELRTSASRQGLWSCYAAMVSGSQSLKQLEIATVIRVRALFELAILFEQTAG
jgi:hypothetical protein